MRPQQHQFVWPRRCGSPGVDAGDIGLHGRSNLGIQQRPLRDGQPLKAEGAGQPVERERRWTEDLRQRAAAGAPQQLELEAPVLGVAEAEAEPRIGVGGGIDVRDAPSVPGDRDLRFEPPGAQAAVRRRHAPAERPEQGAKTGPAGHPRHDATVYSAP
jgi:hypothetical protein